MEMNEWLLRFVVLHVSDCSKCLFVYVPFCHGDLKLYFSAFVDNNNLIIFLRNLFKWYSYSQYR